MGGGGFSMVQALKAVRCGFLGLSPLSTLSFVSGWRSEMDSGLSSVWKETSGVDSPRGKSYWVSEGRPFWLSPGWVNEVLRVHTGQTSGSGVRPPARDAEFVI